MKQKNQYKEYRTILKIILKIIRLKIYAIPGRVDYQFFNLKYFFGNLNSKRIISQCLCFSSVLQTMFIIIHTSRIANTQKLH